MDWDAAILLTEMLAVGEFRQELWGKSNYSNVMKGSGQEHAGIRDPDCSCARPSLAEARETNATQSLLASCPWEAEENSELSRGTDPGIARQAHTCPTPTLPGVFDFHFLFSFKNHPFEICK